jgi:hypothetical protein
VGFGDTLYEIGLRYGVWWTDIAVTNNLTNPNLIYLGQVLTVPCPVGQTSFGGAQPPATAGASTPAPAPGAATTPSAVVPPGCYISDGNACYGTSQSCATTQDWIRGKETCISLGVGTNDPPEGLGLPAVYGGSELWVNGHMRGGWDTDKGHVCGLLIVRDGEPTITGIQASASARGIGESEAIDNVKDMLRHMNVDCGGGYEHSVFEDDFLGRREYP